jgi:hypothetical protein
MRREANSGGNRIGSSCNGRPCRGNDPDSGGACNYHHRTPGAIIAGEKILKAGYHEPSVEKDQGVNLNQSEIFDIYLHVLRH